MDVFLTNNINQRRILLLIIDIYTVLVNVSLSLSNWWHGSCFFPPFNVYILTVHCFVLSLFL